MRKCAAALAIGAAGLAVSTAPALASGKSTHPDFGPNVTIFDPSMPVAGINAKLQSLATASDGADLNRNAVFFMPGTYGSAAGANDPATATGYIDSSVGFMESVQGLGTSPGDVRINGNLRSGGPGQRALGYFWRSLTNMRINPIQADMPAHTMRWSTSQASPLRRLDVAGNLDVGGAESFGTMMANSRVAGVVKSGNTWVADNPRELGQAHYFVRDSQIGSWSGRGANFVFSGVDGAPPTDFGNPGDKTTLPTTPVSRDAPFLYVDNGRFKVFVPAVRRHVRGIDWGVHGRDGRSLPLQAFHVAKPSDSAQTLNRALAAGKHLLLTPGVYSLDEPLRIKRPDTVVMGLGYATLTPTKGTAAIEVGDAEGVTLSSITVDNGTTPSELLIQVGTRDGRHCAHHRHGHWGHCGGASHNPTTLNDVFVRIGGTWAGYAKTALEVNQDDVLIDHTWLWRADHGAAGTTGWTINPSETGLVVNGDDVTALGLSVEHHEKTQVLWNGEGGRTIFFQCEPPYDPPTQALWMNGSENGYPCYQVADDVRTHKATGLISWVLFFAGPMRVHSAYKAPVTRGVRFRSAAAGKIALGGGFENTFNDDGLYADERGPASPAFGLSALRQVPYFPARRWFLVG
jgi:hypothetical protein